MARKRSFLAVVFLLYCLLPKAVDSISFSRYCHVDKMVVELVFDPERQHYYVPVANNSSDDRELQRLRDSRLRKRELEHTSHLGFLPEEGHRILQFAHGYPVSRASSARIRVPHESTVQARRCECTGFSRFRTREPVFCPIHVDHCAIPRGDHRDSDPLYCVTVSRDQNFLRNAIWTLLTWFSCMVIWLLCTTPGRHLVHYIMSCLLPCCWNRYLADRLIRTSPHLARSLMRRNLIIRRTQRANDPELIMEAQAVARMVIDTQNGNDDNSDGDATDEMLPTHLALKCRVYKSDIEKSATPGLTMRILSSLKEGDPGEEGQEECTICYQPFNDGDKVGDLSCRHLFHASCLKEWCARRNACPLCQTSAAEPHFAAS